MSEVGSGEQWSVLGTTVRAAVMMDAPAHDALIIVTMPGVPIPPELKDFVDDALELDKALDKETAVLRCPLVSGRRLVVAPTGAVSPYDDVRSVGEAARRGTARALAAGARSPTLLLPQVSGWPRAPLVALLGALEAIYVPLQAREAGAARAADALGVLAAEPEQEVRTVLREAVALESARALCRDIGGGDPERMTPLRVAAAVREAFPPGGPVLVRLLDDATEIRLRYPLFAAVSRAADSVPRHKGCIVFLEYVPKFYERTVMMVGKGVTYDTGGSDIKISGSMRGMSRDKCGAAAVVGFFKACALLSPRVKALGALALCRNSVGEEAYVADELVTCRRGRAVRVGNTDAEGRMAMADLLAEMAEQAVNEASPHLYTVATLTGHAARAVGGYTAALDNHAARALGHAARLQAAAERLGDPLEVSTIRREDLAGHRGRECGDDLLQAEPRGSVAVPRGHQGPAAFLVLAAGLETGDTPYTHLDVAGSAGDPPAPPTAAPLLALAELEGLLSPLPDCD